MNTYRTFLLVMEVTMQQTCTRETIVVTPPRPQPALTVEQIDAVCSERERRAPYPADAIPLSVIPLHDRVDEQRLQQPIDVLVLGPHRCRVINALTTADILTLEQLVRLTPAQLMRVRHFKATPRAARALPTTHSWRREKFNRDLS